MIRMISRYRLKVWSDMLGPTAGQWAFELQPIDHAEEVLLADGRETNMSKERLELLAVVRGLEALGDASWVYLNTDSRYVRHGLKYGMHHWKANQWRWEDAGVWVSVKHADLWQRVDHAMDIHKLAWQRGTAIDAGATDCVDQTRARQKVHTTTGRRPIRSWMSEPSEIRRQSTAMVA
jgi:ribonuclease HI